MVNMSLDKFIGVNREELIRRCRGKVAVRSTPPSTKAEIDHGVPLFLDQLVDVLRRGLSNTQEIATSAGRHGHDLLLQGFTVSQVIHDYGDVCQSVTDLAIELDAPISSDDFRTLNRCLDDAISGAVTVYAQDQEITHDRELDELRHLTNMAMLAFDMIKSGNVGAGGSTGAMLFQSLRAIHALVARPPAELVHPK
jgi:hypothetical protein